MMRPVFALGPVFFSAVMVAIVFLVSVWHQFCKAAPFRPRCFVLPLLVLNADAILTRVRNQPRMWM